MIGSVNSSSDYRHVDALCQRVIARKLRGNHWFHHRRHRSLRLVRFRSEILLPIKITDYWWIAPFIGSLFKRNAIMTQKYVDAMCLVPSSNRKWKTSLFPKAFDNYYLIRISCEIFRSECRVSSFGFESHNIRDIAAAISAIGSAEKLASNSKLKSECASLEGNFK